MSEREPGQSQKSFREIQQDVEDWQTRVSDLKGEAAEVRLDLENDPDNVELMARSETLENELQTAKAELKDAQGDLEAIQRENERLAATKVEKNRDAERGETAMKRLDTETAAKSKKRRAELADASRRSDLRRIDEIRQHISNL
ncbi:MAG: hypothetical protein A3I29_00025 [Candidatus Magasanikbacteria bacterium RIFCSPLOWO2_02_FULL_44_11]|uniref:Uncharacterized protein n=2 Tax=Candidatus Magasanikiibacteriota TaxID=1752731 RepID=A0A1F6NBQ8_9BACT|nr:MAG: hypothetical protein A3D53_01810 [Candidatus Magasanikbacteria bacterium RIFCSPHIGHO2_02_FULL_45_10]OGH81357.1 MAG: hypothetical protein A3I29_00025 [Candidatus Magasanikbacteria bacterium RIFCSPLOWO2_02_FULL_44_11]